MKYTFQIVVSLSFYLLLVSCGTSSSKQKCTKKELYQTTDQTTDLKGFKNYCNDIIIPCKYDKVQAFRNGLAIVELNGKEFFINSKGDSVSKPYDRIKTFSPFDIEAFTTATSEGLIYVLDTLGHELSPGFPVVRMYEKNGYAILEDTSDLERIFNLETKQLGDPFDYISQISRNNYVGRENGEKRGYMEFLLDQNGKKISKGYENIDYEARLGADYVMIKLIHSVSGGQRSGLMTIQGETILEPLYSTLSIHKGLIFTSRRSKKQPKRYDIYKLDKTSLYKNMDEIGIGQNGMIRIAKPSAGSFAYYKIDSVQQVLTKVTKNYPYYKFSSGGRNSIFGRIGGGYSNFYGFDFNSGFARYKNKSGKVGFLDTTGTLVIPCKYDAAFDFEKGKATVFQNERQFIINEKGEVLEEKEPLSAI